MTQPSQSATTNVAGSWAGVYDVEPATGSSGPILKRGIAIKISNNGSIVTGSLITDSNIQGTVVGTLNNNRIDFTMASTSSSCPGSYNGSGYVNNEIINFSFSGSDCAGAYQNKMGSFYKLSESGNIGWSGNWWGISGISTEDYYTIITLNTTDSLNYTGSIRFVTKQASEILTADLSGVMTDHLRVSLSNLQGKLYPWRPLVTSGIIDIYMFSNKLTIHTAFVPQESNFSGHEFARLP